VHSGFSFSFLTPASARPDRAGSDEPAIALLAARLLLNHQAVFEISDNPAVQPSRPAAAPLDIRPPARWGLNE
jgi:hypothetical protein